MTPPPPPPAPDAVAGSPRGLDLEAFAQWYEGERPGELAGPLRGELIAGGRSNLTYTVTDGRRRFVVRRPPLGHVQATAHDMGREYRVMSALAGSSVPVPQTYASCPDPDIVGAPFYVMEQVPGRAIRDAQELDALGTHETERIVRDLVAVLVALHEVDPDAVGLGDLGRPAGFLGRQVKRWGQQLDGSRSRDLPDADTLVARLADHVPPDGAPGIVHGDYRLDNLLVDPAASGRPVLAVVDWEMATLGDPLTDLALLVVYDTIASLGGSDTGLVSNVSLAAGYPDADTKLQWYAEARGRELPDLSFHLGLAYFKLAVILEGIHFRFTQGQTLGEGFEAIGEAVAPLLAAGLDVTRDLR
ncbi:phosphotransferase family protein [Nocardioides acrostichi]|uniref:Phosphotransferase family protein n=1 Tax=Nocardioides acrostichi TaxID=2784339 RepID=A0A930V354_9ACTN|nr:phosphotransferase family protein [Nocardioides acrostichi]MBF4162947.1 phosphotransferase family protein [Nocardioides acrostichi]